MDALVSQDGADRYGGESTVRPAVREFVLAHDDLADLDVAERRLRLRELLASERVGDLTLDDVFRDIDGFGPLSELMADDDVTDILVNGPDEVWIERAGALTRTTTSFGSRDELAGYVDRWLGDAGARLDSAHPLADACLADGSRIHAAVPPVAPAGPFVSIRRFPRRPLDMSALVASGMLRDSDAERLRDAVCSGRSIAVSGATGTGKTTLLNALLGLVPPTERVITIEETRELRPSGHVIALRCREANLEGAGAVPMEVLVRAALRMRPDRIVIGEVRGPEALDACMAFATGHKGSMVSVHAHSSTQAMQRLVGLALGARSGASEGSLARQMRAAFDLVVQLERVQGARRVTAIDDVPRIP